MRVMARSTLRDFWREPNRWDAEQPLKAWFREARAASWRGPAQVRSAYRSASFVGDRVVFNIAGNKYRLVVWINYAYGTIYIRFIGTHAEYDRIDVATI